MSIEKLASYLIAVSIVLGISIPRADAFADAGGDNLAVFVSGLSGGGKFKGHIHVAAQLMHDVLAANRFGKDQMVRLSESAEEQGEWGSHEISRKENLERFFLEAAARQSPYDHVFIFITGHANGRGEEAVFHLPGPDVDYATLMEWIDGISAKQMILIAALPQGQAWIEKLSRPDRIIIVGSGLRQFDFIPVAFLRLFPYMFWRIKRPEEGQEAVQVSLRDVFMKTQQQVRNWYDSNDLHPTELALLDANGDGKGESLFLSEAPPEAVGKLDLGPAEGKKTQTGEEEEGRNPFTVLDVRRYPMDKDLPDAQMGNKVVFTIPRR